jgi:Xaa-Pro dipeptidase
MAMTGISAASSSAKVNPSAAVSSLRKHMQEAGVAAYLSLDPDNQTYLTGFRALIYSRPIVLLVSESVVALIVPELEEAHAKSHAHVDEVLVYGERPDVAMADSHASLLTSLLRRLPSGAKVGVDAERLPLAYGEAVRAHGHEVCAFDEVLRRLRAIKRADELAAMRVAGELANAGVSASIEAAAAGVSELEIDAAGAAVIYRRAAELGTDATVELLVMTPSGTERSVLPHVFSTPRALSRGDVLIHTRQVAFDGYRAELERTLIVGDPTDEQARAFAVMQEAQQAAMGVLRPGVAMCDVDAVARSIIATAGFGAHAIHRTGHGIGIGAHESPFLRFDNAEPLQEGMVVTIEPGFYVPGLGGFRHSDTLLVTATGSEPITEHPRSLDALTLPART